MGIPKPIIRLLAREHKRQPFGASVLTLGRQNVMATTDEIQKILTSEGISPQSVRKEIPRGNNHPEWKNTPSEKFTNDLFLFNSLGLTVDSLDVSDFEGASIIANLNEPVDAKWHAQFDLVIDGGTIEHVFDVRQAMQNAVRLTKPGGRIIHFSPANNCMNHGFYQFSPTLFFDFYAANRFTNLRCFVCEESPFLHHLYPWNLYEVHPLYQPLLMISKRMLGVYFLAEKTSDSTSDQVAIQSCYSRIFEKGGTYSSSAGNEQTMSVLRRLVKTMATPKVKNFIYRYFMVYDSRNVLPRWLRVTLMRLLFWMDPRRKPWGLIYRGRVS